MLAMNDAVFMRRFGQDVTFTLGPGQTRVVRAIFDNAFLERRAGEVTLDTSTPALTAKDADVVGIARGHTVAVGAKVFDVLRVEPDGTGISTVILSHG